MPASTYSQKYSSYRSGARALCHSCHIAKHTYKINRRLPHGNRPVHGLGGILFSSSRALSMYANYVHGVKRNMFPINLLEIALLSFGVRFKHVSVAWFYIKFIRFGGKHKHVKIVLLAQSTGPTKFFRSSVPSITYPICFFSKNHH